MTPARAECTDVQPSGELRPLGEAVPGAAQDVRALAESHADFVWRSLRRLGVPAHTTDDATQEVFLVASQKLAAIEAGRERAFLFGVAMNVALHVRRDLARSREVAHEGDQFPADPARSPESQLAHEQARALLDRVLEGLSPDVRPVFILFELEELTMVEIATMLGLPQGTVASRLRRGREEFHAAAGRIRAQAARTGAAR